MILPMALTQVLLIYLDLGHLGIEVLDFSLYLFGCELQGHIVRLLSEEAMIIQLHLVGKIEVGLGEIAHGGPLL